MNTEEETLRGSQFYSRLILAFEQVGFPTSQQAIADKLQVSQASVSKWRNDHSYPHRRIVERAGELTKTSVEWLYFGTGYMRERPCPALVAIVTYYNSLTRQGRKRLLHDARSEYDIELEAGLINPLDEPPSQNLEPMYDATKKNPGSAPGSDSRPSRQRLKSR